MKDGLTGVANRRSFDKRLSREQRGESMSILMIDVDFFKAYNDSLGHQAGDICLARLASTMQTTLHRSSDAIFRYGGEEFAVILENVTSRQAADIGRRMKDKVQSLQILHPASDIAPCVTVSVGVAIARKDEAIPCK